MKLSLVLLGIGHFFGLTVLFANTSMTDVIGEQIVQSGGLGQGFETFPLAFLVGATAVVISPAGLIMNKFGYKNVFLAGAFLGIVGSLICVGALFAQSTLSLVLYTVGLIPQGFAYGIVNYYRHVAALMGNVDEATKSWYIAIVISSGALGGVAGPALSAVSEYWYPGYPFVATCICIAVVELLHFVTLVFTSIQIDAPQTVNSKDANIPPPRPLLTIISQPAYFCAFITGTTAHGLMILIMGITPLVLKREIGDIFWYLAFVIQGHVLCMYIPSFFTSKLIAKFSAMYVALFGVIVTGLGASVYLIDDGVPWHHYYSVIASMAIIGVGWNFSFVCATTMITGTYTLQEKFKAQAFNDTWLFGLGSVLTLLSGFLYKAEGGFKFVIVGCVITYAIVSVLNTLYIVWKCQKTKKVASIDSKELTIRSAFDSLKEDSEILKSYEITNVTKGEGERVNFSPNYDDTPPRPRKRMQSMSLADLHFHSKDAEKQFFIHTMNKLSADCISIIRNDRVDTLVCRDPIKDDRFGLAASRVIAKCKFTNATVCRHQIITQTEHTFHAVTVNMRLIKGYLVLIFEHNKSNEIINDSMTWMEENGKFVESLLNVLTRLNSSLDDDAEKNPKFHSDIECTNSDQQETMEKLTALFEKELLKRNVKRQADDFWVEYGRTEFQKRLWYYIEHDDPILFVLPAFPFKSCNQKTKVLGILPDMGEKLALQRLEKFLLSVETIYSPGAYLVMFSDGRVYCDQFRIPDDVTSKFKIQIRRTYPCEVIYWSDLDMFFPSFNDDEKRVALVNLFGTTPEDVDAEIKKDPDFREVYCGFKKFMTEELTVPKELGNRKGRQIITGVAKNLMMRNYSYGHFMKILFPNHVRLSIHPSQCVQKFSVNLVGETDWGTPWHNCALLQPDLTWSLVRRKTAEEKGYTLTTSDDGLPYYVNESGEIFKENL